MLDFVEVVTDQDPLIGLLNGFLIPRRDFGLHLKLVVQLAGCLESTMSKNNSLQQRI